MTEQDIKNQAFKIYAILGELGVMKKQKLQEIENIDSKILETENQLVELSKVQVKEEE